MGGGGCIKGPIRKGERAEVGGGCIKEPIRKGERAEVGGGCIKGPVHASFRRKYDAFVIQKKRRKGRRSPLDLDPGGKLRAAPGGGPALLSLVDLLPVLIRHKM